MTGRANGYCDHSVSMRPSTAARTVEYTSSGCRDSNERSVTASAVGGWWKCVRPRWGFGCRTQRHSHPLSLAVVLDVVEGEVAGRKPPDVEPNSRRRSRVALGIEAGAEASRLVRVGVERRLGDERVRCEVSFEQPQSPSVRRPRRTRPVGWRLVHPTRRGDIRRAVKAGVRVRTTGCPEPRFATR